VPVVRNALQTLNESARRGLLIAALVCGLALLGGCGSSKHAASSSATRGVAELELASCSDWNSATEAQRHNTVLDMREFSGGQVGSSAGIQRGAVLDDARAYKLFQNYCSKYFARGFKLYKLYTHAAAMVGSVPP